MALKCIYYGIIQQSSNINIAHHKINLQLNHMVLMEKLNTT